jgi:hypothetical protein
MEIDPTKAALKIEAEQVRLVFTEEDIKELLSNEKEVGQMPR